MAVIYNADKYFTVKELAEYLGVGQNKAYHILNLPGVPIETDKSGRRYFIDKEKFFEWERTYEGEIR